MSNHKINRQLPGFAKMYTPHKGKAIEALSELTTKTSWGAETRLFSNEKLEITHRFFKEDTKSETGVNTKKKRIVQCLSNSVYVQVEKEDGTTVGKVLTKQETMEILPKEAHCFCSVQNQPFELLLIDELDYNKTWKSLDRGIETKGDVYIHNPNTLVEKPNYISYAKHPNLIPPEVKNRGLEVEKKEVYVNSAVQIGVNLKPVLPPEE